MSIGTGKFEEYW